MSSIYCVKVHTRCPSSKVKFGNNSHSFSSRLNYIITVTVPLLTDVCTIQGSGWISCCIMMQMENKYICYSVVQSLGSKLNRLYDSPQREEIFPFT
jgi:hypothetical protein